jgi:invasion protein IalB
VPARVSLFAGVITAGVFAVPAASEGAKPSALIYSPWSKFCLTELCFTGEDAHAPDGCGPRFAAVVIDRAGEPKKILRVSVPNSVNQADGVRVGIDRNTPIARPYARCDRNTCMADIEAGADLLDRLAHGQVLVITATDASGAPISVRLPLAGFAAAYNGPAEQPKPFENQPEKLQEELKAQQEHRPRDDADRKSPCGAN